MKIVFSSKIAVFSILGAIAAASSSASAQLVNVLGDLGTTSATGVAVSLPGTTNTQAFSLSALNGSITGDVIVANNATGSVFDLTITNLTYTCTIASGSGFGDVSVLVSHTYQLGAGPGPYTGSHAFSGINTNTSGAGRNVQLDSIQDVGFTNTPLPTLASNLTSFTVAPVFSFLPAPSSNLYSIQATLRLRTGGTGVVFLPASAHVQFSAIPEPTTLTFLSGVILVGLRRRVPRH